jgi:lipoprotein NlpD
VRTGDTLYSIAWKFGLDHRDIARWNRLGDGSLIHPGQTLRLSGTSVVRNRTPAPAARKKPAPARLAGWRWPTSGTLAAAYGSSPATESGVQIRGRRGQGIVAAADGDVVYSGTGLASYGQLVIIRHAGDYLSAYGYNERLLVREGDRVRAGQRIANMGLGPGKLPMLHFEVRVQGQPVDPVRVLPGR